MKLTRRKIKNTVKAQHVLQTVAQTIQQHTHDRIAAVVTKAVQAVYGSQYDFRIEFFKRRGKTEAEPVFYDGDMRIDPIEMGGGGMIDVAALALRIVKIVLKHPQQRRALFLDEPMKNIHGDGNRERAAKLIEGLATEFGFQIVLVTGLDWLRIGDVIEL